MYASRCQTKAEFLERYRDAYKACHRRGWTDIINRLPSRDCGAYKWTDAAIQEAIKPHSSLKSFRLAEAALYVLLSQNGRLADFTAHLTRARNPGGHWTKDRCHDAALTCKTRTMFARRFAGAADAALRHGWMDEICEHMTAPEIMATKVVYIIKRIGSRQAYVGISSSPDRRYASHINRPMPHTREIISNPHRFRIVSTRMPAIAAAKLERRLIAHLIRKGWEVVNITKGGHVGSPPRIWDKKSLKKIAASVATRGELLANHSGAYSAAHDRGWLNDIFANHKNRGYGDGPIRDWAVPHIRELASKCVSRADMKNRYPKAFQAAYRRGCLDDVFNQHPNNGYTRMDFVRKARGI